MSGRFALVDYDNANEEEMAGNSAAVTTKASEDFGWPSNSRSHKVNRSNQSSTSRKRSPTPTRKDYGDRNYSSRRSGTGDDNTSGRKTDRQRKYNEEREGISARLHDDSPKRHESGKHRRPDRNCRDMKRSRSRTPEKRKGYAEKDRDYSRDDDFRNRDYPRTRTDNRFKSNRERGRDPREFEDKMKRMYPTKQLSEEEMAKLPSYINPRNVNITKVIEQQEKRKLLWQSHKAKKDEQGSGLDKSAAMWQQATFSGDTDGAVASKFRKLMGLKSETKETEGNADAPSSGSVELPDTIRNQEEIMRNLDRQYEIARLSAHTQRGIGLGFSSRLQ